MLRRYGIESNIVDKISTRVDTDPEAPVEVHHAAGSVGKNVVQLIEEGKIDMILNTPNSRGSRSDGYSIRAAAIAADLPQFTTITEFQAALLAIEAVKHNDYQIMSIQEHSKQLFELERRELLMTTLSSEELQAQRSDFGLRLSNSMAKYGPLVCGH